jgi:hypothetical protein
MKKKLLALLLLVPILLIPILSCEDALGSLGDFMGTLGSNALIDAGIITVNTTHAAAAIDAAKDLKNVEGDVEAYKAGVQDIKDTISGAMNSPEKKEALKKNMEGEADKDDIPAKVEGKLDELGTAGFDFEIETQGDLIAAILFVEFLENVEEVLGTGEDDFDWDTATPEEKDKVLDLISDALGVLEIIETISPTNAIGLNELLDAFGINRGISRDGGEEGPNLEDMEAIVDLLINSIGTTEDNKINRKNLSSMITNFGLMRKTYENLARNISGSGQELEINDALNYLLSVVFTEANKLFKAPENTTGKSFADLIDAFLDYRENEDEAVFADFEPIFENAENLIDEIFDPEGTIFKTFEKIIGAIPNAGWIVEEIENALKGGD